MYRLAQQLHVPPWVLEGYPLDEPPLDWVVRVFEFNRMEMSVTRSTPQSPGGRHGRQR